MKELSPQINKLLTAYEQHLRRRISFKTLSSYDKALYGFFMTFRKIQGPEEIWLTDAETWCLQQLTKGRTLNTIQFSVGVLRAFYNWLLETGYVPERRTRLLNPFSHLVVSQLLDRQARAS